MTGDDLDGTVPWRSFVAEAVRRLTEAGHEHAAVEGRWLVEEAAGFGPGDLALRSDELATTRGVRRFDDMIARREGGEPIQYVLGHWPFRELDLLVDRRVLIPRPETEIVAGRAIELLPPAPSRPRICDLGTGSGAIGLSVLAEHDTAEVWMTDVSSEALAVARANLAGLGRRATRATLAEGSWYAALDTTLRESFDVVVANPPYVDRSEELDASVTDWEPAGALFADESGLADLEVLISEAPEWLRPGGHLVVEHGHTQSGVVVELFGDAGFDAPTAHADLAGLPRFVVGRLPGRA